MFQIINNEIMPHESRNFSEKLSSILEVSNNVNLNILCENEYINLVWYRLLFPCIDRKILYGTKNGVGIRPMCRIINTLNSSLQPFFAFDRSGFA